MLRLNTSICIIPLFNLLIPGWTFVMIILAYNDKQNKELAVNKEQNRKFNNHPLVMHEISCYHELTYEGRDKSISLAKIKFVRIRFWSEAYFWFYNFKKISRNIGLDDLLECRSMMILIKQQWWKLCSPVIIKTTEII